MIPDMDKLMKNKDSALKRRLRKGIPDGIRMKIWPLLAENSSQEQNYEELVNTEDFPYQEDITVDVPRTFPNHTLFRDKKSVGIQSLHNILKALSIKFPEMGYCQGINFIAAAFLMYLNDEEAFYMLSQFMTKYKCMDFFCDL